MCSDSRRDYIIVHTQQRVYTVYNSALGPRKSVKLDPTPWDFLTENRRNFAVDRTYPQSKQTADIDHRFFVVWKGCEKRLTADGQTARRFLRLGGFCGAQRERIYRSANMNLSVYTLTHTHKRTFIMYTFDAHSARYDEEKKNKKRSITCFSHRVLFSHGAHTIWLFSNK